MRKPFAKISDHPVTKKSRGIKLKGVQYLDYDLGEAKLIFEEYLLDQDDQPIIDPTLPPRIIFREISNRYIVSTDGVVISKSTISKLDNESEEEYEERLSSLLSQGIPEFDFWLTAINWETLIISGILKMDEYASFDRG